MRNKGGVVRVEGQKVRFKGQEFAGWEGGPSPPLNVESYPPAEFGG